MRITRIEDIGIVMRHLHMPSVLARACASTIPAASDRRHIREAFVRRLDPRPKNMRREARSGDRIG